VELEDDTVVMKAEMVLNGDSELARTIPVYAGTLIANLVRRS
jgi:hypothetical protein